MGRRVLIASTPNWSFCLAAERDIARSAEGAEVDVVDLFRLMGRTSPHWRREDVLIERLDRKFQRFLKPVVNGRDVTGSIRLDPSAIPPPPEDPAALRPYRVGEARIGLATLSSVVSLTMVCEPASTAEYGPAFAAAWKTAHLSARIGEALAGRGYDEVFVFNGRSCVARPLADVLEAGARVFRYEQGATGNSYIRADRPIHHPATAADLIMSHDYDDSAGEAFYLDRLRKAPGDPVNFYTAAQREGHLPSGIEPGRYVAFFSSSSDEFIAISDDVGLGRFPSQFDAALAAVRSARAQGLAAVVRMHPHLQYKHPSWAREWDFPRLEREGALVLQPGDACDSYALARSARCVFTCGSTVGFECSFMGVPNADVGEWAGARIGAMAKVMDAAEMAAFVANPGLPEGAREKAMRYGSYARRAGKPLPEYDVGSHPNYARIGGRIVDPLRYGAQRVRERLGKGGGPWGMVGGKAILESNIESRAREKGAVSSA
jgi:hypothetical protein